jgi:hypothetical protein
MCPFSKFKNAFGVAGEGLHKFKILNTAMVDYFLTIIFAFLLAYLTGIPLVLMTIILFTLAIILHILFGVNTNTLQFFGIKC